MILVLFILVMLMMARNRGRQATIYYSFISLGRVPYNLNLMVSECVMAFVSIYATLICFSCLFEGFPPIPRTQTSTSPPSDTSGTCIYFFQYSCLPCCDIFLILSYFFILVFFNLFFATL